MVRIRRLRRSSRRRVRRNPPKMTPALRRKIGAAIRARHRAGVYRKVRRSGGSRRRRVARVTRSRSRRIASAPVVYRRSRRRSSGRRVSRRRRSFRRAGLLGSVGGGLFGLKAIISSDNLKMAGGALGGTFIANYSCAFICPKLGNMGGNPFVQAAVKLGSAAIAAKVISRWSRPVAQGVLLGGMIVVANDLVRMWLAKGPASGGTSQYLGRMSQYLGSGRGSVPQVGASVRSLVGPVSPTRNTFGNQPKMGALYGNTGAFKSDAWTRS